MTLEELILKSKEAKTAEELLVLAKENDIVLTEESAKAYYEKMHKSGELSDEELDNVAGGGCYHGDKLVVSALHCCDNWTCKKCGKQDHSSLHGHRCDRDTSNEPADTFACCNSCQYCIYEDSLWLCIH
jgi:hypothetical protein